MKRGGPRRGRARSDGDETGPGGRTGFGLEASDLGIGFALAALTFLTFAATFRNGFVSWDDPAYVTGNPNVLAGLTWRGTLWAMTATGGYYWHPVTWLSHMLDVQVYGTNAAGHHLTSLLIHAATAVLLFALLRHATGVRGPSALVAGLFAVHPLHVESVAWIAERKDVLSGFFWMSVLWVHVSCVRHPSRARHVLALVLFALALASKPMAVTLPFVMLLLDMWPLGRREPWLRLAAEKLPFFALAAGSALLTLMNQAGAGAVRSFETYSLGLRVSNAFVSYAAYAGKMVWPSGLAAFYPYPAAVAVWPDVAVSLFVLVAVSAAAVVMRTRGHRYFLAGWLWYLVTLLPVIGVIQVGDQAMADRFTYVPLIGLFIIVAFAGHRLVERTPALKVPALVAAAGVLVACAFASAIQVRHWRDSMTMWGRAAQVTEANDRAHANLALVHEEQGTLDEAVAHYRKAIEILAPSVEAKPPARRWTGNLHNDVGRVLARQGRSDEARSEFERALAMDPANADAHNNLALLLESRGLVGEALDEFREVVRLRPLDPVARTNLGNALERAGRSDEAIDQYREAILVAHDHAPAHANLAVSLANQGRFDEAVTECTEALRLRPDEAGWLYRLAAIHERRGSVAEALAPLRKALSIDPGNRLALEMLERLSPAPAAGFENPPPRNR